MSLETISAENPYANQRWRKLRQAHFDANPLCAECERQGRYTAGKDVDHIIPHRLDISLFYDPNNLQTLCKLCHAEKTAIENGGHQRASILPSFIPKPAKPLYVIAGRPCAGKRAFADAHATHSSLLIDLDDIAKDHDLNLSSESERDRAIRIRNSLLYKFCNDETDHTDCYLIATSGTYRQRKWWREEKGAEVIEIDTDADTCLLRAESVYNSKRLTEIKAAIRKWK